MFDVLVKVSNQCVIICCSKICGSILCGQPP